MSELKSEKDFSQQQITKLEPKYEKKSKNS